MPEGRGRASPGKRLGVVAAGRLHLLTRVPPFVNFNPAVVIGNHLSSPAPRLATVRPDLSPIDGVLARAMVKEPVHRFATCRAFAAAMSEAGAKRKSTTDATQAAATIETPSREDTRSQHPNHIGAAAPWLSCERR